MKLSIIIPAHNEQENIVNVIRKIEESVKIPHELLVVNDHSTDITRDLVHDICKQYENVSLIDNNLERGFANAIKTGFSNVSSEAVIPIMGDLCDDLFTINKMLDKLNEGYDVICGSRYIKGGARLGGSRLKGFFSCFVGWSLYYLLGLPTHDIANAFKMYRKIVLDKIDIKSIKSKSFEISMEIPLKAYYLGFKITEVPTVWQERTKGKSSFRMLKLFPDYLRLYTWAIVKSLIHSPKPHP